MKVTLIDHTGIGHPDPDHAINVLIFTKSTRLTMSPGLMSEIAAWPKEKKMEELEEAKKEQKKPGPLQNVKVGTGEKMIGVSG